MNKGFIVIIEGVSNTGKSSSCIDIAKRTNWALIKECMSYDPKAPPPSSTLEDEIRNQMFFLKLKSVE